MAEKRVRQRTNEELHREMEEKLWEVALELHGDRLFTPADLAPFCITSYNDEALWVTPESSGEEIPLPIRRRDLVRACLHRLVGGRMEGRSLYESGVIPWKNSRSYLPAIAMAVVEDFISEIPQREKVKHEN
ncbi:MAG: hypothetical protein ICV58_08080 [Rubrobacteraceae bacterium]|nr:hypothetical protein [Rubrobacteraceae bacterium]